MDQFFYNKGSQHVNNININVVDRVKFLMSLAEERSEVHPVCSTLGLLFPFQDWLLEKLRVIKDGKGLCCNLALSGWNMAKVSIVDKIVK